MTDSEFGDIAAGVMPPEPVSRRPAMSQSQRELVSRIRLGAQARAGQCVGEIREMLMRLAAEAEKELREDDERKDGEV